MGAIIQWFHENAWWGPFWFGVAAKSFFDFGIIVIRDWCAERAKRAFLEADCMANAAMRKRREDVTGRHLARGD